MKFTKENIVHSLTSPWLIALIPFALTLLFSSSHFKKYKLEIISRELAGTSVYWYDDLNNDGTSEFIKFYTYENAEVVVYNFQRKLEEVYNLPGKWFNRHEDIPIFYIGDANGDQLKEIFAFTINEHDSLEVSVIQHYPNRQIIKHKFVTRLRKLGGNYDYIITPIGLADNNGDGFSELLFVINAGFPLQPRAVYAYDIKNDSVYRSPLMGVAIKSDAAASVNLKDINGDGVKEIFIRGVAPDNDKAPIPYSDNDSWVMVFTKNLQFLFNPIKIPGAQTELQHFPCKLTSDSLGVGVFIYSWRERNKYPTFRFYNTSGQQTREIKTKGAVEGTGDLFYKVDKFAYLCMKRPEGLRIGLLNSRYEKITKQVAIPNANFYPNPSFTDLDHDGKKELVIYSRVDETLYILTEDLSTITTLPIKYIDQSFAMGISVAMKQHQPDHFLMEYQGVANFLKYYRNPWYYLNFVFALLYYLLLVLAFAQLKKVWLKNLQHKQQVEQEMQKLQVQTIMNQLNPHFTYNAINSIGSAILKNEPEKAYDRLVQVTRLLRKVVDQAFVPYKTLGQEIEFVKEYLAIEQLRFGERLQYQVDVDELVNLDVKIPKMLIQLFVENSVKHGIFHKEGEGKISINITNSVDSTRITVEDNGIGRRKAAQQNNGSTGKGLLILKNYLKQFKEQFGTEIIYKIEDVIEDGEIMGTKVQIIVQH